MDEASRQLVLRHIASEWRRLPPENRPPVVWVREHDAISPDEASPSSWTGTEVPTPLSSVWLLDRHGLQPRDPRAFVHFWAIQMDRPWDLLGSSAARVQADPRWPGHAAFAEFTGTDEFYLEMMWGRRTCARGDRATISASGIVWRTKQLWIS